jgi:hypothetical protein
VICFFDLPNTDEARQDVASRLLRQPEKFVIRLAGVGVDLHGVVATLDDGMSNGRGRELHVLLPFSATFPATWPSDTPCW